MTLEFLNGLHFFPLEKVLFTVFITFSRGEKSRYCNIVTVWFALKHAFSDVYVFSFFCA